jgi:hypothetical protein
LEQLRISSKRRGAVPDREFSLDRFGLVQSE